MYILLIIYPISIMCSLSLFLCFYHPVLSQEEDRIYLENKCGDFFAHTMTIKLILTLIQPNKDKYYTKETTISHNTVAFQISAFCPRYRHQTPNPRTGGGDDKTKEGFNSTFVVPRLQTGALREQLFQKGPPMRTPAERGLWHERQ